MDPISMVGTAITLAVCLKDIIELGRRIRSSVDKPGRNRKRLKDLTDEIVDGLVDLETFYQSRHHVLEGSQELLAALDVLRTEMHGLLEHCLHASQDAKGGRIAVTKAKFKAWTKRGDIEADIIRIKERVQGCHLRFTTTASARMEHFLIVLRTELLVLSNEQQSRLTHVESMVSRLLVDKVDFSRAGDFKALGDRDDRDIPSQYLRMQVREIVDSLKKLAVSRSFTAEEPKGVYLEPFKSSIHVPRMDDPADQHREVVAEALRILRRLKNDRKKMSIQEGAFDLLDLSMSLDGLEMLEDAEITCTWAANLYRTLVQGNVRTFLPWLAACLLNLTALRDALHNAKGALAASQEAVVVHRMVNDIGSPDSLECLAATLGNHSQVLSRLHYFEESLVAAQESVELLRIKVSGEAELDLEAQDLRASIVDIADSDSESEETSGDKTEMPSMKSVEEIVETPPVLSRLVRLKYALGGALGSLADSLSNTDQDVEAYHASKESMDLFRSICESHPGTFDVVLAGALHRSSFCLSTLRRPLEALPLIEEAANIYRGFAKKRPRSFSNLLISSLCHVATLRRGAGGDEDSFAAANEAVSVYRSLVRNNPNFTLYFPKTFQDIAFQLGMLGRKEEALALITEAVETYRTSISDFPSLLPSFAHGLDHLAQLLYSGNRLEDSLMVNTEAVDVYRTLAKDEPTVWSSHLAGSLARLARSFYENNQHDERIAAGNEIIGLSRTAGKESTFLDALKCLQCAVRGVGRPEVTVPICAEILSIQRIHTGEHPTEYPQSFVESLIAHAVDLNRNDQYLDSITVCKEAISLCRSFGSPDSPHDSDAIRAAYHWANGLMFVGRVVEAISVCQETVTTFQRLVGDRSTSHIARVFSDLFQLLSEGYCVRGQFDKAVAANEKAVSLSRQMPPEHHSELAIALRELSSSLLKASNPKDALQASQEAVEVCRNLPPSESDSSDLAYCLDRHSICLINEGRDDHALTAAQEAINLYQQISPNNTRRERRFDCDVWIAEALYDFAAVLAATGRPADALENTKESASIYRIVVTTRPFYLPQFVTVLRSLAVRLSEAGHEAESIDARKEEVTVTQYLVSTYPDLVPALQHTSDLGVTEEVLGRSDLEAKGNAVDRMEWV